MKSLNKTGTIVTLALAASLLGGAAFAQTGAKPMSFAELATYRGADREKLILEGARKEGKLSWYTTFILHMSDALVEGFKKKYPFIAVDAYSGTEAAVSQRVITEYKAGRHDVDVLTVGPSGPPIIAAIGGVKWDSPYLVDFPVGDLGRNEAGTIVTIEADPSVLVYNTKMTAPADIPKQWEDLLKPRWKGKLAFADAPNVLPMILGGMTDEWGKERAQDFMRRLAQQNPAILGVTSNAITGMVGSGDKDGTLNSVHNVALAMDDGAPIAFAALGNTLFSNRITTLFPPEPPHPYAALLFTDFLLSADDGQRIMEETHYPPTNLKRARNNAVLAGHPIWVLTEERVSKGLPEWSRFIKETFR